MKQCAVKNTVCTQTNKPFMCFSGQLHCHIGRTNALQTLKQKLSFCQSPPQMHVITCLQTAGFLPNKMFSLPSETLTQKNPAKTTVMACAHKLKVCDLVPYLSSDFHNHRGRGGGPLMYRDSLVSKSKAYVCTVHAVIASDSLRHVQKKEKRL